MKVQAKCIDRQFNQMIWKQSVISMDTIRYINVQELDKAFKEHLKPHKESGLQTDPRTQTDPEI